MTEEASAHAWQEATDGVQLFSFRVAGDFFEKGVFKLFHTILTRYLLTSKTISTSFY